MCSGFRYSALAGILVLLGTGCGGINASKSVSPATFLIPGFMKVVPAKTNSVEILASSLKAKPVQL